MKEQNRPPSLMGDSLCGAMQLLAGGFCLRQCAYVETSGGSVALVSRRPAVPDGGAVEWGGRRFLPIGCGRGVRSDETKSGTLCCIFCSAAVCAALAVCWPFSDGFRWSSVLLSLLFLSAAGLQISYGMRRIRR
jgi:hypothetical protein